MLKILPRMAAERLVWVLVVAGVACSSPAAPPTDALALADLPTALTQKICATGSPLGSVAKGAPECTREIENGASKLLRQRIALVRLGRLNYDSVAAAACVAGISAENWWRIFANLSAFTTARTGDRAMPAECTHVFGGGLTPGQVCDDDAECQQGRCWGCPTSLRATAPVDRARDRAAA